MDKTGTGFPSPYQYFSLTSGKAKHIKDLKRGWCPGADLNHQHVDFQSCARVLS